MHSKPFIKALLLSLILIGISPAGWATQIVVLLPDGVDYPEMYQHWAIEQGHQLVVEPVIQLDTLEQRLSDGLFEMDAARRIAEAERRSNKHQASITQAWRTALLIHRFKLDHLPAMIIDYQAVCYGLNPRQALDLYQRRTNP